MAGTAVRRRARKILREYDNGQISEAEASRRAKATLRRLGGAIWRYSKPVLRDLASSVRTDDVARLKGVAAGDPKALKRRRKAPPREDSL
jgi:hypothetical protein